MHKYGALYSPECYIKPGNICLIPATIISIPSDIMINPMIRVTTLMPVLPIRRNSKGAARNTNQENKEKATTTRLSANNWLGELNWLA